MIKDSLGSAILTYYISAIVLGSESGEVYAVQLGDILVLFSMHLNLFMFIMGLFLFAFFVCLFVCLSSKIWHHEWVLYESLFLPWDKTKR